MTRQYLRVRQGEERRSRAFARLRTLNRGLVTQDVTEEGVCPGASYPAVACSSREAGNTVLARCLRARLSIKPLSRLLAHLDDFTYWARCPRVNYRDSFPSRLDREVSGEDSLDILGRLCRSCRI